MKGKTTGVSFVENVDGAWDRYTLFLEGRRVIDFLVDLTDAAGDPDAAFLQAPEGGTLHRIHLAMVDAPATSTIPTKGFAVRRPHITPDGVHVHVDSKTIEQYISTRAAQLIARVFVPAA